MLQAVCLAALGTGFTFLMTTLGAAVVFCFSGEPQPRFQRAMLGFAAGVMTAASVWSLLLPAIERAEAAGRFPGWLPPAAGMLAGTVFLAALDALAQRLMGRDLSPLRRRNALLMTAITLPINGLTYTMLYPYNTVTRRNVQVRTDGVRFYSGYERWQDYNLGIINSFELDVPWDAGWTSKNTCCVPCYIYGFM